MSGMAGEQFDEALQFCVPAVEELDRTLDLFIEAVTNLNETLDRFQQEMRYEFHATRAVIRTCMQASRAKSTTSTEA